MGGPGGGVVEGPLPVTSLGRAPQGGVLPPPLGRARHRTVDRRDVPYLPAAAARRVARRGLWHSQRLRAGLRPAEAPDAEAARGEGRAVPALPNGGGGGLLGRRSGAAEKSEETI